MTYRDRRRDRRERSLRGLRESVLRGCCWLEIGRAVSTSVGGEVFFRIANGVGIARGARVERAPPPRPMGGRILTVIRCLSRVLRSSYAFAVVSRARARVMSAGRLLLLDTYGTLTQPLIAKL